MLRLRKVATGVLAATVVALGVLAAAPASAAVHPADSTPISGGICNGATAVTLANKDKRLETFWLGANRALWHRWQLSTGGWSGDASLGGYLTSCIDGNYNQDGRLEFFGRAGGNDLNHIWQNRVNGDGGWSSWSTLGGILAGGPVTWIRPNGGIEVEVLGIDNLLHYKWQQQPNCCWTPDWQ
jgi:hypothetical protein